MNDKTIKAVIIKQIQCGKNVFHLGDTVKITMKYDYAKGIPKEYVGILSQINDNFCCIRDGKVPIPLFFDDMKSIEEPIMKNNDLAH